MGGGFNPLASLTVRPRVRARAEGPWTAETTATTWTKPEAYAWEELPSDDDPERRYYWNAVSGTATWDKPAMLAWKTAEYGFW